MTKIFSIVLLAASFSSFAQVKLAAKTNLLFKTDKPTWESIKGSAVTAYNESGKNNVGFNVGLSAKVNLPASLFLMPEIYYTTFKTDFEVPNTNTNIEVKSNRVDLPVLVGYNVLGDNLGLFIGPVASYNLSKDNQFNDFKENEQDNLYNFFTTYKSQLMKMAKIAEQVENSDIGLDLKDDETIGQYTSRKLSKRKTFMSEFEFFKNLDLHIKLST